jgi:hypothetical protein
VSEEPTQPTGEVGPKPFVWFVAVLLSTALPFLLHWDSIGVADYDQFATFNQIALWWHSLGDYGVSWNPYLCGGATLVGNPQIPLFHPNMIFYRLFGAGNGLGMVLIPWMAGGFWSMWKFGRVYGLRPKPAGWIAVAWAVNGYFIGQLGSMHVMYAPYYLLPAFFLVNRAIARDGNWRALAVVPFMFTFPSFYNHHFLAYGFGFVLAHFLFEAFAARRERGIVLKVGLYLVAVAIAIGSLAMFMLPNLSWLSEFPRLMPASFEPPLSLIQMLFFPVPLIEFDLPNDQFERYYTLGPVLFILFLVSLRRRVFRRPGLGPLLLVGIAAFGFALGTLVASGGPPILPFDALRKLVPVYRSIQVPSRFFINAIPIILLMTGLVWQDLIDEGRWSAARSRWILGFALVPLILFNFGYFQFSLFSQERSTDRHLAAEPAGPFEWGPPGYEFRMMRILEPNVGVLDCYEALEVPQAEDLRAEHGFVLDGGPTVEVERANWGEFLLRAESPASVRFNFNHHRGWRVIDTDGTVDVVSSNREPFAVTMSEGTYARFRYEVPSWALGVKVTLGALAVAFLFAIGCLAVARRSSGMVSS